MSRALLLGLLPALAACGGDAMSADEEGPIPGCPDNSATLALVIDPTELDRGVAATLRVEWELREQLPGGADASFRLGMPVVVELSVPLAPAALDEARYVAELLNPFGALAPAGPVTVLVESRPTAICRTVASAATSFSLR